MKTLTTSVSAEAAADQSGWTEVYDFYLKATVTGPFGSYSTLRLTVLPGGLWYFAPTVLPEPAATQGDAFFYQVWSIKREAIAAASKFTNDQLVLAASNVTGQWAEMLAAVEWRDTPLVIRKVPLISGATAADCVVIFSGQIDSARITTEHIQFTLSNDLGNLSTIAPRENMHTNCRFRWGDDLCTAIRFKAENYKTGTVGSSSTLTSVKSSDFSADTATNPTGAQVVGLAVTCSSATEKITANAHGLENGQLIQFVGTAPTPCTTNAYYYVVNKSTNDFEVSLTAGGSAINLTSSPSTFINSFRSYGTDLINPLADGAITTSSENAGVVAATIDYVDPSNDKISVLSGHLLNEDDAITFASSGTVPAPLVAATTYYAHPAGKTSFRVSATPGGAYINLTSAGTGTHTYSTVGNFQGYQVKSQKNYFWKFGNSADWGTLTQGYWELTDAMSGTVNPQLKPWIQFDLGSAKTPRVWRLSNMTGLKLEELARLIVIFSSSQANFLANYTHESYFELAPRGGILFDCLIPKAATKQYWRICVRTRWAESLAYTLFNKVFAYEAGRHWWASGQITFGAATATTALRNVSRTVLESYSGEVIVPTLPAVPASGDTFTIERGCNRTWNGCNERRNWENFGGFLDLPTQTVIR